MPLLRAVDVRVSSFCGRGCLIEPVSMPLLRAVDVRVRRQGAIRSSKMSVSMPLLRAVDVRAVNAPCHLKAMHPPTVSMPLSRAVDVRAYVTAEGLIATAKCLNALVAGGRCAGRADERNCKVNVARQLEACLNALVAGGRCAGHSTRHLSSPPVLTVSMPLLRAGDVRAMKVWQLLDRPVRAGRVPCLNALVAGGRCAGARIRRSTSPISLLSQCPCCGRAMCGGHEAADGTAMPQGNRVSMPLLRAGDVRAPPRRPPRRPPRAVSMPLLRAGDVRALKVHPDIRATVVSMPLLRAGDVRVVVTGTGFTASTIASQCPCCGRAMCGPTTAPAAVTRADCLNALVAGGRCAGTRSADVIARAQPQAVSMPLLRAGDVRERKSRHAGEIGPRCAQCPCCGRAMCCSNGRRHPRRSRGRRALNCPCCGRVDVRVGAPRSCGRGQGLNATGAGGRCAGPVRSERMPGERRPVSMPLLRAGDVRGEQAARWAVRVALSLQWGRHQSMSEGRVQQGKRQRIFNVLQWGRHQSMSEGRRTSAALSGRAGSDGADISRCRGGVRAGAVHAASSMGPTSVDVGGSSRWTEDMPGRAPRFNGADISRCRRARSSRPAECGAQWGRHQSMSEGVELVPRQCGRHRAMCCGFNGADISRCRKGRRGMKPLRSVTSVLQWGRHQSMSEGCLVVRTAAVLRRMLLQWGRHQSMSEGASNPIHRAPSANSIASMGPTSVDVGGLDLRVANEDPRNSSTASMGPTSVDVGGRPRFSTTADVGRASSLQWGRHQSMSEG